MSRLPECLPEPATIPARRGVRRAAAASLIAAMLPLDAAEIARPFPLPDLGASQQAGPVRVAMGAGGSRALVEEVSGDDASVVAWSRLGTAAWSRDEVLSTSEVSAMDLQQATAEAALGVGTEIRFYSEFFAGDWVFNGSTAGVELPAGEGSKIIELAGDSMAVVTQPTGIILSGGNRVRIHDRDGGSWSEVATVELEEDDPVLGTVRATLVDIAFDGDRLAVLVSGGDAIGVFGRDAGGAGNWGLEKEIAPPPGGSFGASLAISGDRLMVASGTGGDDRGVDVHLRDTGGAAQWGRAGRLLTLPPGIADAEIDATPERLMITGYPGLDPASFTLEGESTVWFYGPGAAVGGWGFEAKRPAGDFGFRSGILAFLFSRAGYHFADLSGLGAVTGFAAPFGGEAGLWNAAFHRRDGDFGWIVEEQAAGEGRAGDFASALAAGDSFLVAGNPRDDFLGGSTGSVLLWEMLVSGIGDGQTLLPAGRLVSPDAAPGQLFGSAVAVALPSDGLIIGGGPVPSASSSGIPGGRLVAVAAVGDNGARGAVYVFDPEAPGGCVRVDPGEVLAGADYFGASVALTATGFDGGAYLVVGAPGDDDAGPNAGAVYVFRRDEGGSSAWGLTRKIPRPAEVGGLSFGTAVAAEGELTGRLAATRPERSGDPGKVALFPLSGTSTTPSDVVEGTAGAPDGFGASVALSRFVMAVGATGASGDGQVHLYSTLSPATEPVVVSPEAGEGSSFGTRVALSYPFLTVGSPAAGGGAGAMSSYLLRDLVAPSASLEPALLFSRNGTGTEALGEAVAAWFMYSFAGAPGSSEFAIDAGRVRGERAGSYEIWALSEGLVTVEQFHPEADPDLDGRANLVEFGLGGIPLSASSRGSFEMFFGEYALSPAMRWTVPLTGYSREWLDFLVEDSAAMTSWSLGHFSGGNDPGETRSYLIPSGDDRRFYRFSPRYPLLGGQSGRDSGL